MRKNLMLFLAELFYPSRCMVCNELLSSREKKYGLCAVCRPLVSVIKEPFCMKCGKKLSDDTLEYCEDCEESGQRRFFSAGRGVYLYDGVMREIMYRFKYKNKRYYAGYFARQAKSLYRRWIDEIRPDLILPVPMYRGKMKKRGYDQAQCFAKALSGVFDIPEGKDILSRNRSTLPQKGLSGAARRLNLKNAFHIRGNLIQSKRVLLVDDIYTTGSTVDAAAEALVTAGAADVCCMYICVGSGKRRRKK